MHTYEIMWDVDDWDDAYKIVECETPHKACLDILREIILNDEKIPYVFSIHNLSHVSFDDIQEGEVEGEILTRDLISIMYLSNNLNCPTKEYA